MTETNNNNMWLLTTLAVIALVSVLALVVLFLHGSSAPIATGSQMVRAATVTSTTSTPGVKAGAATAKNIGGKADFWYCAGELRDCQAGAYYDQANAENPSDDYTYAQLADCVHQYDDCQNQP